MQFKTTIKSHSNTFKFKTTKHLLYELDSIKTDTAERLPPLVGGILTGFEPAGRLPGVFTPISTDSDSIVDNDELYKRERKKCQSVPKSLSKRTSTTTGGF